MKTHRLPCSFFLISFAKTVLASDSGGAINVFPREENIAYAVASLAFILSLCGLALNIKKEQETSFAVFGLIFSICGFALCFASLSDVALGVGAFALVLAILSLTPAIATKQED